MNEHFRMFYFLQNLTNFSFHSSIRLFLVTLLHRTRSISEFNAACNGSGRSFLSKSRRRSPRQRGVGKPPPRAREWKPCFRSATPFRRRRTSCFPCAPSRRTNCWTDNTCKRFFKSSDGFFSRFFFYCPSRFSTTTGGPARDCAYPSSFHTGLPGLYRKSN